jgi:glycosyltransferase involved in cell wall biosynthesis
MRQSRYDIIFLDFGVPLETRYQSGGQLANLVFYLNKSQIKSAICVIPYPGYNPFNHGKNRRTIVSRIGGVLSLHNISANLIRKIILRYRKEDFIDIDILKIKNYKQLEKLDTHYLSAWSWESAYILNKTKVKNGTIKVQVLHYMWEPEYLLDYFSKDFLLLFKEAYFSEMIKIAISKKQLNNFTGSEVFHWVQGINTQQFFYKKVIASQPLQVLLTLRNPKEKGAIYAIQAAKIIHNANKNIKFVSFGNYSGDIPQFIEHHGIVDLKDMIELYRGSDVFILPSLFEGFSLPGLEAMASGCAIISTRNGGSEQYIVNEINGFLVEPAKAEAIADTVLKLSEDQECLRNIALNGQRTVFEYTYEKAAQRFLNILKEIDKL